MYMKDIIYTKVVEGGNVHWTSTAPTGMSLSFGQTKKQCIEKTRKAVAIYNRDLALANSKIPDLREDWRRMVNNSFLSTLPQKIKNLSLIVEEKYPEIGKMYTTDELFEMM